MITVYEDRSFTFVTKTPPAAVLIKQAIGIEKGSARAAPREGRQDHAGPAARDRREEAPDLNAHDVDQAIPIIAGTARSMGVEVVA